MRRKILSLLLASTMILSLAACNKNKTNETPTNAAANGETTSAATEETTTVAAEPVKQTTGIKDYSECVTVGQYTGIEIEVDKAVVTDEDIQAYKDSAISYYNNYIAEGEHILEGTIKEGDSFNMDYEGLLDGVAFAGGTAKGVDYVAGSGQFIEDLDKQLTGLEVGKEYDLPCKFPDDYQSADLKGKDVIFKVKINYIEGEKPTMEWSDELVNAVTNGEFTSAAEYEESFTAELLAKAEEEQKTEYLGMLWEKVLGNSDIKTLPEEKVASIADDYYSYYNEQFNYYASMYSMDYETFLSQQYGMTDEDLKAECNTMAETEVKYIMVSCEIYKALGETFTDEMYNEMASEAASESGYSSAAAFVETYGEEYIRESFIFELVQDYLMANNTMKVTE